MTPSDTGLAEPVAAANYNAIVEAFAATGLLVRGGCGWQGGSVVLIGNAGPALWPAFAAGRRDEPHPLDRWSERVVNPIAQHLGARAVYPSDQPYAPFLAWATAAEPLHASPLGLTIHPTYGLWHAFRAALLFATPVAGLPAREQTASPCAACVEKPCLSACPVGAFTGARYDVAGCAGHLASRSDPACTSLGCRARDACPIGRDWRYPPQQIIFHMAAFAKARGVAHGLRTPVDRVR